MIGGAGAEAEGGGVDFDESAVDLFGGVFAADFIAGGEAHLAAEVGAVVEEGDFVGEFVGVAGCEEEAGAAVFDDFVEAADARADDGFGMEHGLDEGGWEAFVPDAAHEEDSGVSVELGEVVVVEMAEELEVFGGVVKEMWHAFAGAGGIEGDVWAAFGGGEEGVDPFFGADASDEADVVAEGVGGWEVVVWDHIGEDEDSVGGEAAGDEAGTLEFGEGGVEGDVAAEVTELSGDGVSEGIADAFEEGAFAAVEDAPVFLAAEAPFADFAAGHMEAIGAHEAVVMDGHDDGDSGAAAGGEDGGGDEWEEVVDVDEIGLVVVEQAGDCGPGGWAVEAAEEGAAPAEGHLVDFGAAADEGEDLMAVFEEDALGVADGDFFAGEAGVFVVYEDDFHGGVGSVGDEGSGWARQMIPSPRCGKRAAIARSMR